VLGHLDCKLFENVANSIDNRDIAGFRNSIFELIAAVTLQLTISCVQLDAKQR